MAFQANYAGTCSRCHAPIQRGQYINWNRRERGKAYHFDCSHVDATPESQRSPESTDSPNPASAPHSDLNKEPLPIVTQSAELPKHPAANDGLMSQFAQVLLPYIEGQIAGKVDETKVRSLITECVPDLEQRIQAKIDAISKPLTVEVKRADVPAITIENVHCQFPKLLYLVSKGHHVYLHGPAGSGKSTAASQCAHAFERNFGYISLNPQTPESRIAGFIDATGTFRDPLFYRLYKDGGVFCIDELDNSSPALLTTLNGALENGHASFPCGMVPRHKDFVLVATGNTNGRGATYEYPERRALDSATMDRFTFLEWQYDETLERTIALSINPDASKWVKWIVSARQFVRDKKIRLVITPRATFRGSEYLRDATLTMSEIADSLVFKGIDTAIRTQVINGVPLP